MFKGFRAYGKSISFLNNHGLSWVWFFPLIVTALVIIGGFELTSWATDALNVLLKDFLDGQTWLGDWQSTIGTILYWIIWLVLRILLYFAMAFIGGSIIILIMTPVLAYVSEKVAEKLGVDVPAFSLSRFFQEIIRGLGIALKNGTIQILLTIICFGIGFIPVIGFLSPFLMIVINAYYYGFSLIDYSLERRAMSVGDSSTYAFERKFTTTGIGLPFALWMLIPFIGPMTSGFVVLLGTVAATIAVESESTSPAKTVQ